MSKGQTRKDRAWQLARTPLPVCGRLIMGKGPRPAYTPTYLPTYLQLFYYSKVRAAEHYCETNRGGLGRCPRASAVRQDTGTPLRPRLPSLIVPPLSEGVKGPLSQRIHLQ